VIKYSPAIFQYPYFTQYLMNRCPTEAVVLKSLLQHCDKDMIIRVFKFGFNRSFLYKNMDEWQWVIRQLAKKCGPHFAADVFFKKPISETYRQETPSLWNETLISESDLEGLKYSEVLYEWLWWHSGLPEEQKVERLLRGEGDDGRPSLFHAMQSPTSFKFLTELISSLSLQTERIMKELVIRGNKPVPKSNLLHALAELLDFSHAPASCTQIRELLNKYLSEADIQALPFYSYYYSKVSRDK
jgi:hypothetical protein